MGLGSKLGLGLGLGWREGRGDLIVVSLGGGLVVAVHGVTSCSTFSHFLLVRLGSGLGLGLGLGSGLGLRLGVGRREGHGNFVVVVWWWSGSRARRHTVLYIQ